MREHTRTNGRYFRTEEGSLILDWGRNGVDYSTLDFAYVGKGKAGNLYKVYGQVRAGSDIGTFDTYDIKAGRKRLITSGNDSVDNAINAHLDKVVGMKGKKVVVPPLPLVPAGKVAFRQTQTVGVKTDTSRHRGDAEDWFLSPFW